MNRSELKQGMAEWFLVALLAVLGVLIVILHILRR